MIGRIILAVARKKILHTLRGMYSHSKPFGRACSNGIGGSA